MGRARSLRLRLALTVGSLSLALLATAGYVGIRVVDDQMHDNVRDQAVHALELARAQQPSDLATIPPGPDAPPVVVGSGPTRSQFVDPVLSHLDLGTIPPNELYITRQTVLGDPYYIAAVRITDQADPYTIATAAPLAQARRTVRALTVGVTIAVPVLVLLIALVAIYVADRALRPVAVMRTEADAISHGTLDQRLSTDAAATELADLAHTINSMLDRLEAASTTQRRFTSDASHELRSPLATIRAQLELTMRTPETLPQRGPAMLGDVDRLEQIVADLLSLARTSEPGGMRRVVVDLSDLVFEHAYRICRDDLTAETTNVEPVQVVGDQRLLTSLVRNLLDNATRHASSRIDVALAIRRDGTVALIIDDDGPGIPVEHRSTVFERFTRLDHARTRDSGGTGLGLAVAMAAATAHGGTLTVLDNDAGGTRMKAVLPLGPTGERARSAERPAARNGPPSTGTER